MLRPRSRTIATLGVIAGGLVLNLACSRGPLAAPDANILLIVVDALRADRVGAYGYTRGTSPTLDRLATEGALFERAVTQGGWTIPAVASLFTSLYPHVHGAVTFGTAPSTETLTLAEALQASGYFTFGIQTNPVLTGAGFRQGFDSYVEVPGRPGSSVAGRFRKQLASAGGRKFFAYVHLMDVHVPYDAPEPFRSRFVRPYTGSLLLPHRIRARDRRILRERQLADADRQHVRDFYDAGVAEADSYVAEVLTELGRRDLDKSTIVVVTSDHGEELFDRGSFGHGHSLQREIVRVPLIIRHPTIPATGRRVRQLVRLIDIFPTILGFVGVDPPTSLMGRSLGPAVEAPDTDWGLAGFSEGMLEGPPQFALEHGPFKLLRFERPANDEERTLLRVVGREKAAAGLIELFDLREDPDERRPVEAERQRALLEGLLEGERRAGANARANPAREELNEDRRNQLRALGYIR